MATATTNISQLNALEKAEKGAIIITQSTNNPQVPGNTVPLAAFSTSQAALVAANQAVGVARDALRVAIIQRNAAEADWDNKVTLLCSFTESATGGDPEAIVSAGFGVRAPRTPPQPLAAPLNLRVQTNGSPGVSKLTWQLEDADTFLVQMSHDPITPTSWGQVAATTRMSCEVGGAVPGEVCWFRVAGVNALGVGPWSEPARRGVM